MLRTLSSIGVGSVPEGPWLEDAGSFAWLPTNGPHWLTTLDTVGARNAFNYN